MTLAARPLALAAQPCNGRAWGSWWHAGELRPFPAYWTYMIFKYRARRDDAAAAQTEPFGGRDGYCAARGDTGGSRLPRF
jgi:hypothetical protein